MKTTHKFLAAAVCAAFFIYSCSRNNEAAKRKDDSVTQIAQENLKSPYTYQWNPPTQNKVSNGLAAGQYTTVATDANGCSSSLVSGATTTTLNCAAVSSDVQDKTLPTVISSTAARATKFDSTHRFIRTADLRFRTPNTALTTYEIENLVAKFSGYVAYTHLESQVQGQTTTAVSADSSLETTHFTVVNTMTLRIPAAKLDTMLKSLVPYIDFLDHRDVSSNDISLSVLANQLAQHRDAVYSQRMSKDIDNSGKKLNDVTDAEQNILNVQEANDNAMIDNMQMDDQVHFSTITLSIYQHDTFRQELVKNEKTVAAYEPGLGTKIGNALAGGWVALKAVIVFLFNLWPLWFVVFGMWMLVRFFMKRKKVVIANS